MSNRRDVGEGIVEEATASNCGAVVDICNLSQPASSSPWHSKFTTCLFLRDNDSTLLRYPLPSPIQARQKNYATPLKQYIYTFNTTMKHFSVVGSLLFFLVVPFRSYFYSQPINIGLINISDHPFIFVIQLVFTMFFYK